MADLTESFRASLASDLAAGSASDVTLKIESINLKDGTALRPPGPGVTAIVGPNNAGKSTLLRELYGALGLEPGESLGANRIVSSIEVVRTGSPADAIAWLLEHARVGRTGGPTELGLLPLDSSGSLQPSWLSGQLAFRWSGDSSRASIGAPLRSFFVHYANTETRLQQSHAAQVRTDIREPASHPLHVLEDDRQRLDRASTISNEVFGEPLHLDDYSAGGRLKVGTLSFRAPRRDADDGVYRDSLLGLPDLAEQGDGMRSFFGQLLPVLARTFPIVLVDEPEAFLHPPQAAALGRTLGELVAESGTQLLVATHDRSLLTGLVDSGVDLSVVRIDRHRSSRGARQLSAPALKRVWADPAVRFSSALEGLFHRLVVLVEGDGDARFYSAALSAAHSYGEVSVSPSDVLFVPCNGKGGMAKLAVALVALGVPVVASPDLDILQNTGELRGLIEALDGTWSDYSADLSTAVSGVERTATTLTAGDIAAVLPADPTSPLDGDTRARVDRLLRTSDGAWAAVKAGGVKTLGGGDAGAAAQRLLDGLAQSGVVVVREGELESFDPGIGASKSKWVPTALESGVHKAPGPRQHIGRLVRAAERR